MAAASSAAPVEVEPPGKAPTTFAGVVKLLERAEREPDAPRKQTYALAREALALLTNQPGHPAILAQVTTPEGIADTRLLPQNRTVEVAGWRGGLRVAGDRVAKVGERLVSLQGGRVAIWKEERKPITTVSAQALEVPEGEARFVLVRGKGSTFVLDTETEKATLEGKDEGAILLRTAGGATRFAHLVETGGKKSYDIVELPDAKPVASWSGFIAADAARGLAAVSDTRVVATGVNGFMAVVHLADGRALASRTFTMEKFFTRVLAKAKISPDGRSIAGVDFPDAWRVHLDSPRDERLLRTKSLLPPREVAFTADGKHVCVDAPGLASPRAPGVAGTTQRCYVVGGVAHVASLPAPPPRFRRAAREDFTPNDFGYGVDYEAMSPDGKLVANLLYDGKPWPMVPQRFAVAVTDAATGKQLWSQFCGTDSSSLLSPPEITFSADAAHLMVDGVRVDARTGAPVDGVPVALASLEPLFDRFGLEPGKGDLKLMRLGQDLPFFQKSALVWTADLAPRPLSVFLDPTSLTVALRANGSKLALVLASGATSALAILPDGTFATSGSGSDLVCAFGDVLAPFDLCRDRREIPAMRVAPAFVELAR
jgi:hypothetical protein